MGNSTIRHPNGSIVDLPLLVPSFSSKGFGYFSEGRGKKSKVEYSETTRALELFSQYLRESFLLSAYDIHHKNFRRPQRFLSNSNLVLLDSGGYELNPEFDSSEPKLTPTKDLLFERSDYVSTLDSIYERYSETPVIFANFDWGTKGQPYLHQIQDARKLQRKYPKWGCNLILKPIRPRGSVHHIDEIIPIIEELHDFDVIGVTEKELGKDLIDRLKLLAKLRLELNRRDVKAPLHVWGGLDPLITPLYFFAGADIFDGVSWLRYAYHDGLAVNREGYSVLRGAITTSYDHTMHLAINENLFALQALATNLRDFVRAEPDFGAFDFNGELFERAYRSIKARVPELEEIR